MKKITRLLLSAVLTLVVAAVFFYIAIPAINIFSQDFWFQLTLLFAAFGGIYFLLGFKTEMENLKGKKKFAVPGLAVGKIVLVLAIVPIVVLLIGNLISSEIFNAEKYANIIEVEDAVFEEDMPEADIVTNIALMDSASANYLGNRKLGALSDLVSQYEINGNYYQINYHGAPEKISTLEYVDFFRWLNNHESGIPGYVMVDPVNNDAEYVEFQTPIRYTDSAFLNEDLHRKLRFSYPTKIFGSYSFELDEEGNPFYIVSCMMPKVGIFGAMDVNEVIIFDPCTGESECYALSEVPSWVDNVFTGSHASEKYDWYGTLSNGFFNSIIGKRDCKITTDDFGYIMIEDDVWFFTGVTSVSSDESNIGFLISNARTGEYKFYSVNGAEEYTAMRAAQGEVQEKGYVASFPSLINVSGQATYIMVLKDEAGIVKLYALVNVENAYIVTTASTQAEAKEAYIKLLYQQGVLVDDGEDPDAEEESTQVSSVTIKEIRTVTVDGNSVIYLTAEDGVLYKQRIVDNEELLLLHVGDVLNVEYTETEHEMIRQIVSFESASIDEE